MKNNIKITSFFGLCLCLTACNFSASVDFVTGISTTGNGLSVNKIYLSDGEKVLETTEFEYGQKFFLNFDNITGLKKENGAVFPGMEFSVLNKIGDTIIYSKDLYANQASGYEIFPLALMSNLTVANPIVSNEEYILVSNIWDKKGEGTFKTEMDFKVISNPEIIIKNNGLSAKEIYLSSMTNKKVINNEIVNFGEKVQVMIEGLEGFKQDNNKASINLSMKLTDADDNVIINQTDLLGDDPVDAKRVNSSISPYFVVTKGRLKNPVTCFVELADKVSSSKMVIETKLTVQ